MELIHLTSIYLFNTKEAVFSPTAEQSSQLQLSEEDYRFSLPSLIISYQSFNWLQGRSNEFTKVKQ